MSRLRRALSEYLSLRRGLGFKLEGAGRLRPAQPDRRKAWQLCSQVARTLSDVLAGQCDDQLLCSLDVLKVEPAPDTSRTFTG